jgi:putative cell wall-binding protein
MHTRNVLIGAAAAAALTVTGAAPASAATYGRFGGSDRYDTAANTATAAAGDGGAWANGAFTVLIARGDVYADALAGSYLAGTFPAKNGSDAGAPILLTATDSLPQPTINALAALKTSDVVVLGGTAAVSDAVVTELKGLTSTNTNPTDKVTKHLTVTRIGGQDRFETAQLISEHPTTPVGTLDMTPDGHTEFLKTAVLATGRNFADALASGPIAYQGVSQTLNQPADTSNQNGFPLLLTEPDHLSESAAKALKDLGIQQVIIAGGTAAVSDQVATDVAALPLHPVVQRIAGGNRQETSAKLAQFAQRNSDLGSAGLGFDLGNMGRVLLVRGDNFPDALTAGAYGGALESPVILAESPTTLGDAGAGLTGMAHPKAPARVATDVWAIGGQSAIATSVLQEARADLLK